MGEFLSLSSSPSRIRQANVAAALQAIFAHRQLSRAELARLLGLNRSSSGKIVAELTEMGLVREVAEAAPKPTRAGRPGILLELVPDGACFIGVEIGVEHITVVRIDLLASVIDHEVVAFEGQDVSVDEAVERAMALAFDRMSVEDLERCEGLGLSAPAQMDRRGRVRVAPLLGWRDVDLAALTREALPIKVPCMVENDANAFAIGDAYARSDRRQGVTLFLVIESGVGGGIVVDGRLFRGGHGLAGEIGHLHTLDADCAELEETIGRARLLERYGAVADPDAATLAALLTDVRDRVPAAVGVAEEWARHLAFALVQVCRVIDPDRIVLGGSVAALYPLVSARVAFHMEAFQSDDFPQPEIAVHAAAETGAAYGAACMLHQRFLAAGDGLLAPEAGPVLHREGALASGEAEPKGDSAR
jgi:predicted NBD/HSP70 family sugar kinase